MEGEQEGENSPVGEHSPLPLPGTPKFEHQYYQQGHAGQAKDDGHSVGGKGGSKGVSGGTGKKASPR